MNKFIKEEIIRIKIKIIVCFIKIEIEITLIKKPKNGGIPPSDKILVKK